MDTILHPVTCGYCEQPLNTLLDSDDHMCSDKEFYSDYVPVHKPFHYSASALAEARQFLTDHPDFREHQDLNAHRRVGAYDSHEQEDYITPADYTTADELPITRDFTTTEDREAEWDGIYENRDNYQTEILTYWRDVEPDRCTHATYWWSNRSDAPAYPTPYNHLGYDVTLGYNKPHVPTNVRTNKGVLNFTEVEQYAQHYAALDYEAKDRDGNTLMDKLFFEELQGFASERLEDWGITERYAFRFFNIYYGRDGYLHVGLLKIDLPNKQVTCYRSGCYFKNHPLPIPTDPTRDQMETFVHALIRHGNNHGPDFIIKRNDFSYIHAENCNTQHNHNEFCNALKPSDHYSTLETLSGSIDFLINHRKVCRDERCRCTLYYHTLCHYERERTAA